MDFETNFLIHSLWGAFFALFFFSLPGLWMTALLGFEARLYKNISGLFIAPALGLCTYGPFSLLITWLFGYSVFTVLSAWIIFLGLTAVIAVKFPRHCDGLFVLPGGAWLLAAAALWAVVPVVNIFPAVFQDGLFVNGHIFDHMKIALVDTIAREGMPPLNPFYAPAGERIPLIYYYTWHFLGSQIKLLAGVSGWQAEVALNWFTGFALMGFLAALAVRLSGRLWAGFALLLLALAGPPARLLPHIMGQRWKNFVGPPPTHPVEVLWTQLAWAPQHVFGGLCVLLLIFLTVSALRRQDLRWSHSPAVGLTAAAGFGTSVFVGGVALVLALPALLFALWRLRLGYARMWVPLLLSVGICVLFALPVLSSLTSGPSVASHFPLALKPYIATGLFNQGSTIKLFGHIVLYWVQFLPLCLGIVYVLGVLALAAYSPRQTETRIFKALSIAAILSYLLAVQFVQSVVMNNDFGWRSVLVPYMLLLIWAAVALAEVPRTLVNWRPTAVLVRWQHVLMPLVWMGITVGLLASFFAWHWPKPYSSPRPEKLALHQDFFRQSQAWKAVRRHTAPGDLVQGNPATYAKVVTPWPAPMPLALFGDRPTAYTDPSSVNGFAHPYDKGQKAAQNKAVQALFVANPGAEALAHARDTLRIKALLIDRRDPVWPGKAIEDTGIYRLAEAGEHFKIYLAN
ncbi:MAG: hypothetical protein SCH71_10285 [Desulfobulbaceae bacterium]|nr:hypothetical protein [Desulfobulbaceae bacterium]